MGWWRNPTVPPPCPGENSQGTPALWPPNPDGFIWNIWKKPRIKGIGKGKLFVSLPGEGQLQGLEFPFHFLHELWVPSPRGHRGEAWAVVGFFIFLYLPDLWNCWRSSKVLCNLHWVVGRSWSRVLILPTRSRQGTNWDTQVPWTEKVEKDQNPPGINSREETGAATINNGQRGFGKKKKKIQRNSRVRAGLKPGGLPLLCSLQELSVPRHKEQDSLGSAGWISSPGPFGSSHQCITSSKAYKSINSGLLS